MVPVSLLRMSRVSAGLPVILLAITCLASSQTQAPTASAPQTHYAFCLGRSSPAQPTRTIYISDVFSLPVSAQAGVRPEYLQYIKSRDGGIVSVNCIQSATQQQAANAKQSMENSLQQIVQRSATTANPFKLVETGWQYQPSAAPVTQTATRTVTTTTTRRAIPAITPPATATRTPATSTIAAASAPPAPAATPATGTSSIGQTVSSTGQNAKQSVTQSVQGVESSTTATVTNTITSTTNAGQTAIQNKVKGWQDKMFHKSKPAATPAPTASPSPANTAAATPAPAPTATLVSASTTPTPVNAAARPTIQDEGDGKTFVLTEPGQTNSIEVTQAPGTKNAYIDAATGDKYIVMPDGSVKKILHHK